jgi:GDPmannose 4,6-dehydratase
VGDPSKASRILGWKPEVAFKELVEMMVDSDLSQLSWSSAKRATIAIAGD